MEELVSREGDRGIGARWPAKGSGRDWRRAAVVLGSTAVSAGEGDFEPRTQRATVHNQPG